MPALRLGPLLFCPPIADAARQLGISTSRVSRLGRKFDQLGNSIPWRHGGGATRVCGKFDPSGSALSASQLSDYSEEHLKYEILMFFNMGIQLWKPDTPDSDATAETCKRNAFLESFVIHLRNLLLFLYNSGEQSDVMSDHYFDDHISEWRRKRPPKTDLLMNAHDRANEEISHLTVFRRKVNKDWPVLALMKDIKDVLQRFVDNAPGTKLHPSVKTLVDSIVLPSSDRVVTEAGSSSVLTVRVTAATTTSHISSMIPLKTR